MRNQIWVDKLPVKVINNLVLIGVEDTFEGFTTKGGIHMVNLTEPDSWADSSQYNISEFVMRHGKVILVPEVVTKGSFDYNTDVELAPGDTVWWNLISFQNHTPIIFNKRPYLLVDYHEILARSRNGVITPINGNVLFSAVPEVQENLGYRLESKISDNWRIEILPEKRVRYEPSVRQASYVWEVGDIVKLVVRRSPYKLEGTIQQTLDKEYYCCPINFIICTS